MININKKATNNICGMFIDEYLEDGNASGYCVIQTRITDEIALSDCEDIFSELKEKGIIRNNSFSDNVWVGYYDLYETNIYFDFNIDASQEMILSFKKYILIKLYLKKNEVTTAQIAVNHIKDMIQKTNLLDIDTASDFMQYVSKKQTILYLSDCKEFLQFCTIKDACEFYSKIKSFSIQRNPISREIPDYESILKYDCLIRDFINTGNIDLRIKYYPILIWWMISTIIPLRPSEFVLLKRNCIYKEKDKYYIHIERVKSKANRKRYDVPIMTEFQIPKVLFEFISDFIDCANEIDSSSYLVSDGFYIKQLTRDYKRNKQKITLSKFNWLFGMFEKEVVEDIYHYEIVALGTVESSNQIERIRLGDTRHLAFMNMLMQGLNPLYIQRIGGHYTLEEQLSYCNHLDTFTSAKTYVLSKMLNNKNEMYYRNYSDNVDWGLKQTEKELLGAKFYQLPKVKDGAGRCTSTNFPTDCKCEECLFCEHFIPEKDVAQTYISELKQNNLQNIEIKKELLKKLLKEQFKDEKEIGTVSRNLASLINQEMILDAYTLNLEKGGKEICDQKEDQIYIQTNNC